MFQVAAISEQSSESPGEKSPLRWKLFDMRAVVAATEDIFQFILSENGLRVRVLLVRDILKAADIFLEEKLVAHIFDEEKLGPIERLESEVCVFLFLPTLSFCP